MLLFRVFARFWLSALSVEAWHHATADDPILTDVDTDSEMEDLQVRLPHGIPLDTLPPNISLAVDRPVEQESKRAIHRDGHLSLDVAAARL